MTDVSYAYTVHLVTLQCIKHLVESSPMNQPDSAAVNWVHSRKTEEKKTLEPSKFRPTSPKSHGNFSSFGYGSKLGTPKLWMVNTKLDIHICGPLNGLPFWPTSISPHHPQTRREASVVALPVGQQLQGHLVAQGTCHVEEEALVAQFASVKNGRATLDGLLGVGMTWVYGHNDL